MKMIEIWINCPDQETARKIADVLIGKRHVACSNIFAEIQSSYRWKGRIESEPEIPLVVKTREENFSVVVEEVRNMHPYETPSIIGVPVEFVNEDYLAWVYSETE
jgi:periplasmic divalent cation tolerance protein